MKMIDRWQRLTFRIVTKMLHKFFPRLTSLWKDICNLPSGTFIQVMLFSTRSKVWHTGDKNSLS